VAAAEQIGAKHEQVLDALGAQPGAGKLPASSMGSFSARGVEPLAQGEQEVESETLQRGLPRGWVADRPPGWQLG
jgi:hypothetical protein